MALIPDDVTVSVLNIGTAVLVRDVMDQHLRTLGDVRTYYASNMTFALQSYSERHLDLIFCELTFPGGSAEEFIRRIGGLDATDNLFFVVSTAQDERLATALAEELSIDAVLMSPFSTNDIIRQVNAMLAKKSRDRSGWIDHLLEAKQAAKNRRVQEARSLYKELIKGHPTNEEVLFAAAKFYSAIPDYEAATDILTNIIALNPKSVRAKTLFGLLNVRKGDYVEGMRILEECQKVSPLCTGRALEIASCYVLLALRQARVALDTNNSSSMAILNTIKYLAVLQRYKEVVSTFERSKDVLSAEEKREAEYFVAVSKKLGNLA